MTLKRARESQNTLNAFRVIRDEEALAEAEEADRRIAAGDGSPLLGVPVAIKDDIDLTGHTTPFGCGGGRPATRDAEAVRRLREAGAIVIGKTHAPEVGQWHFTVLTPTTAKPPPRIGALEGRGYWATSTTASTTCPFAFAWNVVGWPAISVPAGLTADGLPIGAQLLGRECDEATLLSLAGSIERAAAGI